MPNTLEIAKYLMTRSKKQLNKQKLTILLYQVHKYELLHYETSSIPSLFYPTDKGFIHTELNKQLQHVSNQAHITKQHFPNIRNIKTSIITSDFDTILQMYSDLSLKDLQKQLTKDLAFQEAKQSIRYPHQVILASSIYKNALLTETGFLPETTHERQFETIVKKQKPLKNRVRLEQTMTKRSKKK